MIFFYEFLFEFLLQGGNHDQLPQIGMINSKPTIFGKGKKNLHIILSP